MVSKPLNWEAIEAEIMREPEGFCTDKHGTPTDAGGFRCLICNSPPKSECKAPDYIYHNPTIETKRWLMSYLRAREAARG